MGERQARYKSSDVRGLWFGHGAHSGLLKLPGRLKDFPPPRYGTVEWGWFNRWVLLRWQNRYQIRVQPKVAAISENDSRKLHF
jgi:hypothetical protein